MLILHDLPALHWAVGGAGIAFITLLMLAVAGKRLGVSTGFESLCAVVLKVPYLRRDTLVRSHSWRLLFLGGLVLGGALSAALGGGWAPTWDLGLFDTHIGWGPVGKLAWIFVGGLFIGFGTRLSGGCTSGHGIFGLSNFEASGLVATLGYMAAGAITTNVVFRLFAGLA